MTNQSHTDFSVVDAEDVFHISAQELADTEGAAIRAQSDQRQLELMYSKYQMIPRIKAEFVINGFREQLEKDEIDPQIGIDVLTQVFLHKKADYPTLAGSILKWFDVTSETMDHISELFLKMAHADYMDCDGTYFYAKYGPNEDIQKEIEKYQYPLPMIVQPNQVKDNRDTGYQTIKNSIVLKNHDVQGDRCLDHINRMNKIPLTINASVAAFIENSWRHLDKPKPDETMEDFQQRRKAFDKYDRVSKDVIQAIMAARDRFWLTHKYDFRGRTYSQGYHINYQGADWNKACIEFADKEPLNEN